MEIIEKNFILNKHHSKSKSKKSIEKRLQMERISNLKLEDVYLNTAQKICKDYEKENEIYDTAVVL